MARSKTDKFKVQVWANYILIKHGKNSGNAIDKLIYGVKHFSKYNKKHKHPPGLFNGYRRGSHDPRDSLIERFETDFDGKYKGARFWIKNAFWIFTSEKFSPDDLVTTYQLLSPETLDIEGILCSFHEIKEHEINSVNEAFDLLAKLFGMLQALDVKDKEGSRNALLSLQALMSASDLYCIVSMFQPLSSIENELDSYIASILFNKPAALGMISGKKKFHYKMLKVYEASRKKEVSDNEKIHYLTIYQKYIHWTNEIEILELYKENKIKKLKSNPVMARLLRHMRDWRRNNKELI